MISKFDLVVAADLQGGIGKDGALPWKLPGDMHFFKTLTSKVASTAMKNAVVMGRKTWESIPQKWRPLPDRVNVVITRDAHYKVPEGVLPVSNLDEAMTILKQHSIERCFVVGGGEIYRLAIEHPACDRLYITEVEGKFECDTFFPEFKQDFELIESSESKHENGIDYCFKTYRKIASK